MRSIWLALALALGGPPAAADAPSALAVELNTVEQVDEVCRLTFTVRNRSGTDIEAVTLETVIFDAEGGVADLALFDFREVPAGRTRVRRFDLAERPCGDLGGFLLNGVAACTVAGSESPVCARPEATSRIGLEALR